MRTLYFLLPGTGSKFACGGLWAELKTLHLAQQICSAEVVTYRQREQNTLFLDDLLRSRSLENVIFVVSWGFDAGKLSKKLQHCHVIYHAHSAGYNFQLPANIPIITVSRNTMGYWGQRSPNSLIYYLPNQISAQFQNLSLRRDIDVLVQARKSSSYLMNQLVPDLQKRCRVHVVTGHVDDLGALFNRAKVYLYDSAEYWAIQRVSEGFGLQPLEAMACGCQVFSSVNGGLSDYLDPGFNCYKIAGYSQEYDVERILKVVHSSEALSLSEAFLSEYRTDNILKRLTTILSEINHFFDCKPQYRSTIPGFSQRQRLKFLAQKLLAKLKRLKSVSR